MNKLHTLLDLSPLRFGVAVGYTIFVIIILIQPTPHPVIDLHIGVESPSMRDQLVFAVGHLLIFAGMVAVWCFGFWHRLPLRTALVMAFCVALLFSVGTEIGQLVVSSRDPSLFDLATDFVGASLSVIILYAVLQGR